MPYPHTRLHFIYILSACAAGTESIPLQVCRVYCNLYCIINQRIDKDRREGGLTLSLRIVRGDSNQSVNPILRLKVAIRKLPLKLYGSGFYTRLITIHHIIHRDLIAIALSPTGVHSEKHRTPVVALSTASA